MENVVSLPIAKTLNWKKETEWWWKLPIYGSNTGEAYLVNKKGETEYKYAKYEYIPAPTLGELVRELPKGYRLTRGYNNRFMVDCEYDRSIKGTYAPKPEDACALMFKRLEERGWTI